MFALADCNNFYASCERVFRPDLNNKPIVVLSNNDGCVIARSNEAKTLGIPMGAPAYKFEQIFKEKGIHVFSSNYALYGDMSARVMDLLSQYTPDIEFYSIDEAFLKFEGFDYINFETHLQEIKRRVHKSTGIPISIGLAPTKALAKVANHVSKKFPERTKGTYIIDSEEKRIKALKWLKVGDIGGVGRQNENKLKANGVNTAYQFTLLEDDWVKKQMSIVGLRLKKDLEGKPTLDLEEVEIRKNISTTRTFENNYSKYTEIAERVSTFAISCSEKLRKQNSCCQAITLFLSTNRHRKDLSQYKPSITLKLPFPTNSSIEIGKFAISALNKIFRSGYQYKRAGIIVSDFVQENEKQINLFENSDPKHKPLMEVIDKLNSSLGQQKIKLGSQDLKRTWKMKQNRLSQKYTTSLNEVISISTPKS